MSALSELNVQFSNSDAPAIVCFLRPLWLMLRAGPTLIYRILSTISTRIFALFASLSVHECVFLAHFPGLFGDIYLALSNHFVSFVSPVWYSSARFCSSCLSLRISLPFPDTVCSFLPATVSLLFSIVVPL